MKEENYLEGIYGCLERIEKKVGDAARGRHKPRS